VAKSRVSFDRMINVEVFLGLFLDIHRSARPIYDSFKCAVAFFLFTKIVFGQSLVKVCDYL